MASKKASATARIIGFITIVIGGAVISFGPTQSIKIIGGLLIAIGTAFASLT